jgi:hypothetical protein
MSDVAPAECLHRAGQALLVARRQRLIGQEVVAEPSHSSLVGASKIRFDDKMAPEMLQKPYREPKRKRL